MIFRIEIIIFSYLSSNEIEKASETQKTERDVDSVPSGLQRPFLRYFIVCILIKFDDILTFLVHSKIMRIAPIHHLFFECPEHEAFHA